MAHWAEAEPRRITPMDPDGAALAAPDAGAADVHGIAAQGTQGTGQALPHLAAIQRSFGPAHDLSSVQAHVGGETAQAAEGMGAEAFTRGDRIAFRAAPDVALAAHEAAHFVQQRSGLSPPGGVGQAGDSHEQQADAVAQRVVSGLPAADLLPPAGSGKGAVQAVQRAPLPRLGPQEEMKAELANELALFKQARLLLGWLEKQGAVVHPFQFTLESVLADRAFLDKLLPAPRRARNAPPPPPRTVADLKPIVDLLVYYKAVLAPTAKDPKYTLVPSILHPGKVETFNLDKGEKGIQAFKERFDARTRARSSLSPVAATGLLPIEQASDRQAIKKEQEAEAELKNTESSLDAQLAEYVVILEPDGAKPQPPIKRATAAEAKAVAGKEGWYEITVATKRQPVRFKGPYRIERVQDGGSDVARQERERIQRARAEAHESLRRKRGYRTFNKDVLKLLERLRKRNTSWRGDTYDSHWWGEFSMDTYLLVGHDSAAPGFYRREVVMKFFDDLDAAAEEDDSASGGPGKFAWRALYNDDPLAYKVNQKYGAGRVNNAPEHGPDPDHKLHIHLDLRPVNLKKDEVTGYQINQHGRVELTEAP